MTAPVRALLVRGLSGGWRLCPGAEVFGAGVPGQEAFQCRAGEGLAAVAAAFVEVGSQPGQDVQADHLGGGGGGPDDGGEPSGSAANLATCLALSEGHRQASACAATNGRTLSR